MTDWLQYPLPQTLMQVIVHPEVDDVSTARLQNIKLNIDYNSSMCKSIHLKYTDKRLRAPEGLHKTCETYIYLKWHVRRKYYFIKKASYNFRDIFKVKWNAGGHICQKIRNKYLKPYTLSSVYSACGGQGLPEEALPAETDFVLGRSPAHLVQISISPISSIKSWLIVSYKRANPALCIA